MTTPTDNNPDPEIIKALARYWQAETPEEEAAAYDALIEMGLKPAYDEDLDNIKKERP